ncbi:PP2C family protein-serine/threonine phosphatase [Streptomyces sp. NPDC046977]|uniref:PP2C family protein-serine/threonine phosphatase n=1 Tax=Streptomyces sp. NPDC046977 TaxID=3154703 RepID=UPI003403D896
MRSIRGLARHTWVWWLPIVLAVVDIALDFAFLSREPISFLLTGVPPLAAATRTPRATAALTALCLALQMWMASLRPGHFGEEHHVALYLATLVIGAASVALAAQRERTKAHLIRANSVAEAMQATLLRPVPPALGPVRAAGFYQAGEHGTLVGGDLYDLVRTPFGVRVIVGDVRGKGLEAVRTVSAVLGGFRVAAHEHQDLALLAQRLELSLARNVDDMLQDAELFVTAVLLEFPEAGADGPQVRVVDRGHPPPLVLGGPDGPRWLSTRPAPPLGLGDLSPRPAAVTSHPLRKDEVLVVCTDGVTEARDPDGTFYPLPERLAAHFAAPAVPEPETVAAFVRDDAERWADHVDDDRMLLALSLSGGTGDPH